MSTNIKPLGRLLVHTLLAKADNDTATVPPEYTPALSTLVAATGMAKSAVAEHLTYLEELGWVKRARPPRRSRTDRTQYFLLVGREDPARPSSPPCGPLECDSEPSVVREADSSFPGKTHPVVRHTDSSAVRTADSSQAGTTQEPAGSEVIHSGPHGGQLVVRTADSSKFEESQENGGPSAETLDGEVIHSCPPHGHASSKNNPHKSTTKTITSEDASDPTPPRADVERVCRHLADKIAANGSKRPSITQRWRDEARLLIDRDGRTVDQILACIDWCQSDAFWRTNILSMPKLRAKYDQLRLSAQREQRAAPAARTHNRPGDIDWDAAMQRAADREARG